MHCSNCGKELPDDATFCTNCGTRMTAVEASPAYAPKKQKKKSSAWKVIVIIVAALVLLAGLAVGAWFLFGDKLPFIGGAADARYTEESLIAFGTDSGVCFANMSGETVACYAGSYTVCMDGTAAYACDWGGPLYYCTAGEKTKVAEDAQYAAISFDGKFLIYVWSDGEVCKLCRYDADTGDTELLDKFGNEQMYPELAVSPDGKSVLYTVPDDGGTELFLSLEGQEPESLGENRHPIVLSDKGEYVYYCEVDDRETSLYVMHDGDTVRIGRVDEDITLVCANRAGDELSYGTKDATYLSMHGEKAKKISAGECEICWQPNACYQASYISTHYNHSTLCWIDNIDSYCDAVWILYGDEDSLVYVDGDGEAETLVENVNAYLLSDTGRKLLYQCDEDLFFLSDVSKGSKATRVCEEEDVRYFDGTPDMKHLYVLTTDSELYYANLDGTWERIDKDVKEYYSVNPQTGACCYGTNDGQWYSVDVGGEPECLSDVIDGITSGYWRNGGLLCYCENENNNYDFYVIHEDLTCDLLIRNAW